MSALPTTEGAGIWGEARIHPAHLLPLLPVQSHPWLPSGDEERGEEMVGGSFFLPRGLLQRSLSADKGPASGSPFSGHPLSSLLTAACPAPSCSALRRTELKRGTFRSGRSLISCPLQTSELRAQEPWPPPLQPLGEFWGMGTISPSFRVDVLPGWPHLGEGDYLPAISLPSPGPQQSLPSPVLCAAPEQPDRVPDGGPLQHRRLEAAVPQAPVTVQAGGGGRVTCP